MSLRLRLMASLASVLVLSLALAAALACAQAIRSVRTELTAALSGGVQAATDLAAALGSAAADPAPLARLVAAFDGNRHVRIVLLDAAGSERTTSHLLEPAEPPPGWFVRLVQPDLPDRQVAAGQFTLRLHADPVNEVSEVWEGFADDAIGLGAFCALAGVLTLTTLTRVLRPLAELSAAFPRLAAGEWETRVAAAGPPEVARLAHGFNDMAARLAAAEAETRRLQRQLQTLQEEERAELARDLHDEIGPLLFAANVATVNIHDGAERDANAALAQDALALQELIARTQRDVRALLRRLRSAPPWDLDLAEAIDGLAAFWRGRYPAVQLQVRVALARRPEPAVAEALYRCIQEGLANAFRHGRPERVDVAVEASATGIVARVADDGPGGTETSEDGGLGLIGMRERVAALGGTVSAGGSAGQGWVVTAKLPWNGAHV
jgi:two-component system, NarL family, sensor histidine kinase UhpB